MTKTTLTSETFPGSLIRTVSTFLACLFVCVCVCLFVFCCFSFVLLCGFLLGVFGGLGVGGGRPVTTACPESQPQMATGVVF